MGIKTRVIYIYNHTIGINIHRREWINHCSFLVILLFNLMFYNRSNGCSKINNMYNIATNTSTSDRDSNLGHDGNVNGNCEPTTATITSGGCGCG